MNRRSFLKGTGVTTVVLAGGVVWRAADQGVFSVGQGPAYEAWKNWQEEADQPIMKLVKAAILAANPHNSQPWSFRVSESRIDLFAVTSRNLGAIDPYLREMYIGLGCALENLLLAAKAEGYDYKLTLMPSPGDTTHVAGIDLKKGQAQRTDLYDAIPNRHTDRGGHVLSRSVSSKTIQSLNKLNTFSNDVSIVWLTDQERHNGFAEKNYHATKDLIKDHEQSSESFKWGRGSWDELQEKKDGISIDTAPIPDFIKVMAKIMPQADMETTDKYFLEAMKGLKNNTSLFGIITVKDSSDLTQRIKGGMLWQRMHLWGSIRGLGMGPINQLPERVDRETMLGLPPKSAKILERIVKNPTWVTLMPFRIGYPTMKLLPSPRRPAEEVLI